MVSGSALVVGGVALRAGVRLVVAEADYLYGTGVVTLVVSAVDRVFSHAGEEWVEMHVQEIGPGDVLIPRFISVRVAALRNAVRTE